jgi:hypothetical protein
LLLKATNAQGGLYGFELTQAISRRLAQTIAEAASQFGQEDDITVLTLAREGVEASAGAWISVPVVTV